MFKEVKERERRYYDCDPDLDTKLLKALWRAVNSPKFKIKVKGKYYAV